MKCSMVAVSFLILLTAFIYPVQAATNVAEQTQFYYDNGTSFTHPGIYDNFSRVDNVWYFNNAEYTPIITYTEDDIAAVAIICALFAAVVVIVLAMFLRRRET